MRFSHLSTVALGAVLALNAPTRASTPEAPRYTLTMAIRDGDRLIGEPRLQVLANEPARIEIDDGKGSAFAMTMTATPDAAGTVRTASVVDITSGNTRRRAEPILTLKLGQAAHIAFGEESATARPIRIDFTVTSDE